MSEAIVATYSRQVSELSDARGATRADGEARRDETGVECGAKVLVRNEAPVNGETKAMAAAMMMKQRELLSGNSAADSGTGFLTQPSEGGGKGWSFGLARNDDVDRSVSSRGASAEVTLDRA